MLSLRKNNIAFRKGGFKAVSSDGDKYFVFEREYKNETSTVVCNFEQPSVIECKDFGTLVLNNYSDRVGAESSFRPYEIAVFKA